MQQSRSGLLTAADAPHRAQQPRPQQQAEGLGSTWPEDWQGKDPPTLSSFNPNLKPHKKSHLVSRLLLMPWGHFGVTSLVKTSHGLGLHKRGCFFLLHLLQRWGV